MFTVADEHQGRTFEWGVNDCCLFVARVVDAMTDSDFEAQILSRYSDEASALRFIAEYGSLQAAVSHYLGEPVTGYPMRGDVVLSQGEDGEALGICTGREVSGMSQQGIKSIPASASFLLWKVA